MTPLLIDIGALRPLALQDLCLRPPEYKQDRDNLCSFKVGLGFRSSWVCSPKKKYLWGLQTSTPHWFKPGQLTYKILDFSALLEKRSAAIKLPLSRACQHPDSPPE
ncbi:hypothetical protein SKAU_G00291490 [Synaphobranchus kaupii]|uniref:Uncharacterized protein n=1 Tax=Synaphobranchus kaupii TaxID=118154 RepID=A0A9Q1ETU5_SYNKA|nr:hypothetical protein SKAU_G00291490 [Synaphobranchus kaupii]